MPGILEGGFGEGRLIDEIRSRIQRARNRIRSRIEEIRRRFRR